MKQYKVKSGWISFRGKRYHGGESFSVDEATLSLNDKMKLAEACSMEQPEATAAIKSEPIKLIGADEDVKKPQVGKKKATAVKPKVEK